MLAVKSLLLDTMQYMWSLIYLLWLNSVSDVLCCLTEMSECYLLALYCNVFCAINSDQKVRGTTGSVC